MDAAADESPAAARSSMDAAADESPAVALARAIRV
jgi:hypothetical protein